MNETKEWKPPPRKYLLNISYAESEPPMTFCPKEGKFVTVWWCLDRMNNKDCAKKDSTVISPGCSCFDWIPETASPTSISSKIGKMQ